MALRDLLALLLREPTPAPGSPLPTHLVAPVVPEATDTIAVVEPEPDPAIPDGVTVAAGWAWRLLAIGALVVGLWWVMTYFSAITVPIATALLLTALLFPSVMQLRGWGWHPAAAAATALLGMIVIVVGVLVGVGAQVTAEAPMLVDQTLASVDQLLAWLSGGPLGIDSTQIDAWWEQAKTWVTASQAQIAAMAASAGAWFGNFFAGLAIALVATFFFAYQGRQIFGTVTGTLVPARERDRVESAAQKGWASLVAYMRAAVLVAAVDAAGVAVAAAFLGLPMVWALFALTFFASFIPVVGAVAAGFVAVALALVTHGPVSALIMLVAVIVVMQAEGNLLQPLLLGRAVNLHPLAVILGLTLGATLSGIVGALLVIPALAFIAAFVKALRSPSSLPDRPEFGPRPRLRVRRTEQRPIR